MTNKPNPNQKAKPEANELEDYEPGAGREEVMAALKRTAKPTEEPTPRRAKKPEK